MYQLLSESKIIIEFSVKVLKIVQIAAESGS